MKLLSRRSEDAFCHACDGDATTPNLFWVFERRGDKFGATEKFLSLSIPRGAQGTFLGEQLSPAGAQQCIRRRGSVEPLARVVQYPVQRLRDWLEERCRIGIEWQHAADLFNPRRDQLRQQTFA